MANKFNSDQSGQQQLLSIAAADIAAALAKPPAIGGTTPSTAAFTTATLSTLQSANGDLAFKGQGNGQFVFGPSGWAYTTAASGAGSIFLSNGTADSPNVKFAYGNNLNLSLDVYNQPSIYGCSGFFLRFVKNADESGGAVVAGLDTNGNFSALSGVYGNGGLFAGTLYGLSASGVLTCSSLTVAQNPTASATASNYSIPIVLNGTTYYLRLSSTP